MEPFYHNSMVLEHSRPKYNVYFLVLFLLSLMILFFTTSVINAFLINAL